MKNRRGREQFYRYKWLLRLLSSLFLLFPRRVRHWISISFRNKHGKFGAALRYSIYKTLMLNLGDNVYFGEGLYLLNIEKLQIGNNVSIHPMTYIDAAGGVIIGDDVSIAEGSTILSTEHIFDDIHLPIRDQGLTFLHTTISSNTWMGAKSTVIAGVFVSTGSVIGANTIITKDTVENGIYVGNPGKLLRIRGIQ